MRIGKGRLILISGVLAAASFVLNKLIGYRPITIVLMLITMLISGTPIFKKAFGALRFRIVGIDALVTIAVFGAIIIGEYWEAAAVAFLFTLGDYLESRTIEKTRSSIKALLDMSPDRARVRRGGVEEEISPDEVVKGDLVIVRPGEKIPVDGSVIEGDAFVNQAAITGESIPVGKSPGDEVFSGAITESGYLVIEADRVGDDTTFARILQMVEEAQDKKTKTQKFLEKFSRYYTPGIIVLTAVVYVLTRDFELALTLLVIACPGALVIATPVSIVAGIGNGAKNGVLIKGGEIMEGLGSVRAVAFDKTGTLTAGKPRVTKVKSFGMDENELLRICAIGEAYSEHPLGRAIIDEARERLGDFDGAVESANIAAGLGIVFSLRGEVYYIGNRKLFIDNKIDISGHEEYLIAEEEKGQTVIIAGGKNGVFGIISVADVLRDEAKGLIGELRAKGVRKIVMLTGDNARTAGAISAELGLDDYYSDLLPEDKVGALEKLKEKYGRTAMVGDGVNDAPALASADLGIAVGGGGSDVAMETADVVLMAAGIGRLPYALGLGRATVRNMKQNITMALLVAALLLAGVLVKTVTLPMGMLIHEASVLVVVINAVRLLRYGRVKGFGRLRGAKGKK